MSARFVSPRALPVLVLASWALLLAAWAMGNAPFAAPDEADHFVRAVGISEGHLIGRADPSARIGITPRQIAWTSQATRLVLLPAGLDPTPFTCELGSGLRSAACLTSALPHDTSELAVTAVGNYQPLPYLAPAALLRLAKTAPDALRWARVASALLVLALLAAAVFALFDPLAGARSLFGLLLAVTPMALFCGASLSGSGTEIAGAIAFVACLLRLGRATTTNRWWWITALCGATLVLSRSASPLWLVIGVLLVGAWDGHVFWSQRRPAKWTALALGAAIILNRIWEALYGSHLSVDFSQLHAGVIAGLHQWWRALPELVGKFGYLDVKLPLLIPLVWFALTVGLIAAVAPTLTRHERVGAAAILLTALLGPAIFYALLLRPTGFGLQGRHVLPVLAAVPLLAGEALYRQRISGAYLRMLAPAIALMQLSAWLVNAKRYAAGGSGLSWFYSHAAWSPPGGWVLWTIVSALGALGLAAVALSER